MDLHVHRLDVELYDGHRHRRVLDDLMDGILIEIRAAEGGDDAKLLVREQAKVYLAACKRHCL